MPVRIEVLADRLEDIEADALLLPVDGQLCRLGGAATSAIRAALQRSELDPEERTEELAYLEDELARLRPLAHPQARAIDGVARWPSIIVSAAYPHNVDGAIHGAADCTRMIRAAIPSAISAAGAAGMTSLAAPLIGTAYRMTAEQAIRAFADGLAASLSSSSSSQLQVRWSLPDVAHRALALAACERLGLHR